MSMDRRRLIRTGGLGVLALGLGGCASRAPAGVGGRRGTGPGGTNGLVPVRVSWDRVIRTTVGLRPFRPSGFVVRADRLDLKTVVHNYGHGGAGHSLSWGTAALAAELALEHDDRVAAVLGCGVVGLTTARTLQRKGFQVVVYARELPPETASNMAWASFTPESGLFAPGGRTSAWDGQFRRAAVTGYHQLQLLVGRGYGISWIDSYSFLNRPPRAVPTTETDDLLLPDSLRRGGEILGPGEHPFPSPYARRRPTLRMEPNLYLASLVTDVRAAGGRIEVRSFDDTRDLMALDQRLLVNCTGLGAGALFGDGDVIPVKGQLTFLVPQSDVNYATFGGVPGGPGGGRFPIHMMPRADGIALGGTSERGVASLEPNVQARREIVEASKELFDAMAGA